MQWLLVLAFAHAATYGPDLDPICLPTHKDRCIALRLRRSLIHRQRPFACLQAWGGGTSRGDGALSASSYLRNLVHLSGLRRLLHIQPGRMLRVILGRMTWPLLLLGAEIVISLVNRAPLAQGLDGTHGRCIWVHLSPGCGVFGLRFLCIANRR